MVNWGELVIAAAVVVEKFERRIAVGAKKDRRRPRMSSDCAFSGRQEEFVWWRVVWCGPAAGVVTSLPVSAI